MTRFSQNVLDQATRERSTGLSDYRTCLDGRPDDCRVLWVARDFSGPHAPLMGKAFILSIAMAAIASIALLAKNVGAPVRKRTSGPPECDLKPSKPPARRSGRRKSVRTWPRRRLFVLPVTGIPNLRRIP